MPRAVSGRPTPRGRRDHAISFRVRVTSSEQCENLSVTYSYTALFNGRGSLAGSATDFYDTNKPASGAAFVVRAEAGAADVVSFNARGACEQSDGTVLSRSAAVAARVRVAAHSCEEGPLRVLAARGSVARQDLVARSKRVPVRIGHYVWTDYHVWLGRGSRVSFGAAACNRLRQPSAGRRASFPASTPAGRTGRPCSSASAAPSTSGATSMRAGLKPTTRSRSHEVSEPVRAGSRASSSSRRRGSSSESRA